MKKQVRILMLALACLALTSTVAAQSARQSLEGFWQFSVIPDPPAGAPYSGVRSFSRDGAAISFDGSNAPSGNGFISVGAWERSGAREFRFAMYAILTTNGVQSGRRKIEGVVTLDPSGNTLSGIGKTASYDLTGKELFSGTAKLTGVRIALLED